MSILSEWLTSIFVGLEDKIYSYELWGRLIGASAADVKKFMSDDKMLPDHCLDIIVFTLQTNYTRVAASQLARWNEIKDLPIGQTAPLYTGRAMTLARLRVDYLLRNLMMALGPCESDDQISIVEEAISRCYYIRYPDVEVIHEY